METTLQVEAPPLRRDAAGALRIGNSRVLLELVIHAFEDCTVRKELVKDDGRTVEFRGTVHLQAGQGIAHEDPWRELESETGSRLSLPTTRRL